MYLYFMDKKFDLMNPDGFSHFNGPIFYYCGCGMGCGHSRTNIVVTCDYFYGLEKLNVSMEYKFPKNAHKVDSLSL